MRATDPGTAVVGPADGTEAAELATLAALTFPLACPPGVAPSVAADFAARNLSADAFTGFIADPARRVLAARTPAGLAGYALLVLQPPADPQVEAAVAAQPAPTAELSKFYAHPAAHGTGAAASLMTAVLRTAGEAGARSVWLGVNNMNLRAQAFYRKSGFTVVGRKQFLLGAHRFDDLVLARSACLPVPGSAPVPAEVPCSVPVPAEVPGSVTVPAGD